MKMRVILHSDVNNFFASVECSNRPELKDKPVAVAGDPEKRTGIILAKNELAKKFGVKTGDTLWQARNKCKDIVFLKPHMSLYEKISKRLHEIYLSYTDLVEPLGLDECFLDITPSLKYLQKTGKEVADEIRKRVKEELNLTVSVGVSFTMVYAKLGSDLKKPDATTLISYENFKKIAYPLPLDSIVGIGRRLYRKFSERGIDTIGKFCALPEDYIKLKLNKTGQELYKELKGEIFTQPKCYYNLDPPKSFGNGTTTIVDIIKREDISKVVAFLCEKISSRLAEHGYMGSTIRVSVRSAESLKFTSHSQKINPTFSAHTLYEDAMKLLDSFFNYDYKVRSIRVSVSSLSKSITRQISMFDEKQTRLTESIKDIRDKYGYKSIFLASDNASYINTSKFMDSDVEASFEFFLDFENLDE